MRAGLHSAVDLKTAFLCLAKKTRFTKQDKIYQKRKLENDEVISVSQRFLMESFLITVS